MPLRDCEGCLDQGFCLKLRKTKSEAVENFHINSSEIFPINYVEFVPFIAFFTSMKLDRVVFEKQ